MKDGRQWRFDTAAGKEEVLARRIGRNELAAIGVCRTYVARAAALRRSRRTTASRPASTPRRSAATPARRTACTGRLAHGQRPQPARRPASRRPRRRRLPRHASGEGPTPFHGYYFRILTAQGPPRRAAPGTTSSTGELTGGFALVAWPAQYDATGVMTFIVNQDGVVSQKDLGPDTATAVTSDLHVQPGFESGLRSTRRCPRDRCLKREAIRGTERTQTARRLERRRATATSVPWRKWGPYLSERQWGTVREDYSDSGDAWNYFTHDQARSRAYRWGEDGLAGISDDQQLLCFALASLERQRSDPQGAAVRPDQQRGQSRRGREGVLLLPRLDADALVHEVSLQVSAGRVSRTTRSGRDQPASAAATSSSTSCSTPASSTTTATSTCSSSTRRRRPKTS